MNPELAGWQILTAFVILGGELCYWIDRWEARSYAKALPLIEAELKKLRSPRPRGSGNAGGSDIPQSLRLHGGPGGEPPAAAAVEASRSTPQTLVGTEATPDSVSTRPRLGVSPPAPPDTASSRVAVSGGLTPASAGDGPRTPAVPALAGLDRWQP